MTVPIIPGPFSFLGEAGEAAGAIGESITARRDKKMAEAQAGLNNILALVNAGRLDPSVLNSPEIQGLLKVAKIPVPMKKLPVSQIASADIVARQQFQPSAEDIIRQRKTAAISGLKPGGPEEAEITGVPTAAMAGARQRTTVAGARTAEAGATTAEAQAGVAPRVAGAEARKAEAGAIVAEEQARVAPAQADVMIAEAQTRQKVFQGALETLGDPKDPLFRRLAQEAALGILNIRLQRMEMNRMNLSLERQAMADYARLLIGSLHDINQTYKGLHDAWENGLRQAVSAGELNNRDRNEVVQEFVRDFGPEPTYDDVRDDYLKSNLGLTIQQFHDQIKNVLPMLKGEQPRSGEPTAQGAATKVTRAADMILKNPTATTIGQLGEAVAQGYYRSGELLAIKGRLQGKVKPDVMTALQQIIDQAIAREDTSRR